MKKKLAVVLTVVLALSLVFCLFACNDKGESDTEGTMYLVLCPDGGTPVAYTVELSNVNTDKGLMGVLEFLKSTGALTYEEQSSEYGGSFLTEVGDVKQDAAKGKYVYIYTDVDKDKDVSQYATTVEYKGKTLTNSGVGAGAMTLADGCTIYIGIIVW